MMSANKAARAYVDAVNAGDADRLVALFAADAVLHHPTGDHEGADKIREFYTGLVLAGKAELQLGRVVTDDADTVAMFELTASSPLDNHMNVIRTLDVLDVDTDGSVTTLSVYYA